MVPYQYNGTRMYVGKNCVLANITYKWSLDGTEHMKILHSGFKNLLLLSPRSGTILLVMAILGAILVAGCMNLTKIPSSTGAPAVSGGPGPAYTTVPGTVITSGTFTATAGVTEPWSGSWDSDWGTMQFTQSGNEVTATYTHDEGRIKGTVSGNTLTGTWSESPSYQPPDDAGDVVLTMAANGNSFTGNWRYGINTGTWDGIWTATKK